MEALGRSTRRASVLLVRSCAWAGGLVIGAEPPDDIDWLTRLAGDDTETVQRLFSTLGDLWSTRIFLARAQDDALAANTELTRVQTTLQSAESRLVASLADVERLTAQTARYQQAEQRATADQASLARQVEGLTSELAQAQQKVELSSRELTAAARTDLLRDEAFLGHFDAMTKVRGVMVETLAHSSSVDNQNRASLHPMRRLRRKAAALGFSRRGLGPNLVGAATGLIPRLSRTFRRNVALLDRSCLFDLPYYASHAEVRAVPRTRLKEHFIRHGDRAGLSPHPLFDHGWYRERNADLPEGERLVLHYLRFGSAEGRDPHPLFSSAYYRGQSFSQGNAVSLLTHYLRGGSARALSPHPLFDLAHYLLQYPALSASAENPLMHYLDKAWREMPDPHPLFSTRYIWPRMAISPRS